MGSSNMILFFFFTLSLVSFTYLSQNPFAMGVEDLIHKTCKATKDYKLCLSALKSDPTSSKAADTKGLAIIMIGVAVSNATSTSTYLSSQVLSMINSKNTYMKQVLKECSDKYSYSADAFQNSVQDLSDESYDYAYMHIMAASDYPNACRNAFKRFPGLVYPPDLARREEGLKRISDVLLGIIDLLAIGS